MIQFLRFKDFPIQILLTLFLFTDSPLDLMVFHADFCNSLLLKGSSASLFVPLVIFHLLSIKKLQQNIHT